MTLLLQIVLMHVLVLGLGWSVGSDVLVGGYPALLCCAVLAMGIEWMVFVPSAIAKSERFYDLTGGVTYLAVVCFATWMMARHGTLHIKHLVLAGMVAIWALRLSVSYTHLTLPTKRIV